MWARLVAPKNLYFRNAKLFWNVWVWPRVFPGISREWIPLRGGGESLDIKQLRQLPGALTIRWTFGILLGEHGLSLKSASEIEKRLVAPIWFP